MAAAYDEMPVFAALATALGTSDKAAVDKATMAHALADVFRYITQVTCDARTRNWKTGIKFPGFELWVELLKRLEQCQLNQEYTWNELVCTEDEAKEFEAKYAAAEAANSNSCNHFFLQLTRLQRKKKAFIVLFGQLAYNYGQLLSCFAEESDDKPPAAMAAAVEKFNTVLRDNPQRLFRAV
jgi:hypothetical protein